MSLVNLDQLSSSSTVPIATSPEESSTANISIPVESSATTTATSIATTPATSSTTEDDNEDDSTIETSLAPHQPLNQKEIDDRSIYIGNVDFSSYPADLKNLFSQFGEVNRVTILYNRFTGRPKGYAYVEFNNKNSIENAVSLNGSVFKGREISVVQKRTNLPGLGNSMRGRGRGRGGFNRGGLTSNSSSANQFSGSYRGTGYRGGYRGRGGSIRGEFDSDRGRGGFRGSSYRGNFRGRGRGRGRGGRSAVSERYISGEVEESGITNTEEQNKIEEQSKIEEQNELTV